MKLFSLAKNYDLAYTCIGCGKQQIRVAKDCCANMFKVSKVIFRDQYSNGRAGSEPGPIGTTTDDVQQINTPLQQGQVGESGYGTQDFRKNNPGYNETNQALYLPRDGSPADDFGVPGNADNFLENTTDSSIRDGDGPFTADKNKGKQLGIHNMPTPNKKDVFRRIRNTRKDQL